MSTKIARIGLVRLDIAGNALTGDHTISQHITATQDFRILPDASNANTANYPTVEAYLNAEETSGRALAHIDQYMVVTQTPIV